MDAIRKKNDLRGGQGERLKADPPLQLLAEAASTYWEDATEYIGKLSKSRLMPGPIDPHDDPAAPIVIRRYLLGCELVGHTYPKRPLKLSTALPRENVLTFFYPHSLRENGKPLPTEELARRQMRRDVFLLAFAAVHSLPASDKWSFYQIGGIHGLPHVPYDNATGSSEWDPSKTPNRWGGYCQHGSPLFPTWHRPYVMLLEQSIIRQATLLSESLSDAQEVKAVMAMAGELRFPYWDWANYTSRMLGLPDIFSTNNISLLYPWKSSAYRYRRSIPNPLKSFVLPENLGTPISSSDNLNPAAKPHYDVPATTPFTPLGYPTVRHVSSAYTTQNDKVNLTLLRNAETTLVQNVHAVFQHQEWLSFSNHYWSPDMPKSSDREYGHYSSIELVHDIVHDTIGGAGGHMSYPEIAGFDPIFFFHHCNVDRLIALWQYCYPLSWIPSGTEALEPDADGTFTLLPDSPVDSTTELTPFRCSPTSFVCSDDVRIVDRDCGYSYPELVRAREHCWTPAKMLHYMLCLYKPPQHFLHMWFLVLERINKGAFNGPFAIRVFLDLPDADARTPISSPHYAGTIFVFARQSVGTGAARCANCEVRPDMRASLELTKTMIRLGITTAPEMSGDDGTVQPPQNNPLASKDAITLVYVNPSGDALPPPDVPPLMKVVYENRVADEQIYSYLLESVDTIDDVVSRTYGLPKPPYTSVFPITDENLSSTTGHLS